jgi:hypothetical protein
MTTKSVVGPGILAALIGVCAFSLAGETRTLDMGRRPHSESV